MFRFDRVLVGPSREELEAVLKEAAAVVSTDSPTTITWEASDTDSLLRRTAARPEGFRQWNGPTQPNPSRYSYEMCSAVAVAWRRDALNRVHYRIAANFVHADGGQARNFLCPGEERPPWWLIYPEHICFREEGGGVWTTFAACRCGAGGDPEALGWMGPCCAACFDRAEAGEPSLVPDGEPARLLLRGHERWVGGVLFTPDGRLVSHDRHGWSVFLWDLATARAEPREPAAGVVTALALAPDGDTAASGLHRNRVVLWSLRTGRRLQSLSVAGRSSRGVGPHLSLAFSPDGSLLALAPNDRVELWEVSSGQQRAVIANGLAAERSTHSLAFSPDGNTLAVALGAGLMLWVVAGRGRTFAVAGTRSASFVVFAPDGNQLGLIDPSGRALLFDLKTERSRTLPGSDRTNGLSFSPDGRLIAAAGEDGALRLFDGAEARPLGSYLWHTERVNAVAFSADDRWIATASDDGCVKLWPVAALLPR
jgi:sugar lactone lactonase YvrE